MEEGHIGLKGQGLGPIIFVVDVDSFSKVGEFSMLQKMLEESIMSNDGITLIKR